MEDVSLGGVIRKTKYFLCSVSPLSTTLKDPKDNRAATVWHQHGRRSCQQRRLMPKSLFDMDYYRTRNSSEMPNAFNHLLPRLTHVSLK